MTIKWKKTRTRPKQSEKTETETHTSTCRGASWEGCVYKLIWDLYLVISLGTVFCFRDKQRKFRRSNFLRPLKDSRCDILQLLNRGLNQVFG